MTRFLHFVQPTGLVLRRQMLNLQRFAALEGQCNLVQYVPNMGHQYKQPKTFRHALQLRCIYIKFLWTEYHNLKCERNIFSAVYKVFFCQLACSDNPTWCQTSLAGYTNANSATPTKVSPEILMKHAQLEANSSLNSSLNSILNLASNCELGPPNQVIM